MVEDVVDMKSPMSSQGRMREGMWGILGMPTASLIPQVQAASTEKLRFELRIFVERLLKRKLPRSDSKSEDELLRASQATMQTSGKSIIIHV